MEEQLFKLKFTAKQLNKSSVQCEKEEKKEKAKLKKAIEKGNLDGARIYAQNAIRQKNQAMNYLRLGSRVDAVAARFQTAVRMNQVTKQMGGVVKLMDKAMGSMNIEQISKTMDQFEKQFEDLDVKSEYIENAIDSSTAQSTPQDEVDRLISAVADEHNLTLSADMAVAPSTSHGVAAPAAAATEEDELAARLEALKRP